MLPWLWLASAFLLLLPPLFGWLRIPPGYRWLIPETPMDGTRLDRAEEWRFLHLARDSVPPGSSFTVLAPDPAREMSLFMMSFGLLPDRDPLPTSYFSIPQPDWAVAEYVLAFGCDRRGSGSVLVRRLPEGCVYRRRGAPR